MVLPAPGRTGTPGLALGIEPLPTGSGSCGAHAHSPVNNGSGGLWSGGVMREAMALEPVGPMRGALAWALGSRKMYLGVGGGGGAWSPFSNPPPPGAGTQGRLSFVPMFRAYFKSLVSHITKQNCLAACSLPNLKCRPRLLHARSQ